MEYRDLMGSAGTATVVTVDGRRARAVKTREAIVDAAIALLDSGDLKPTAASIASQAGLSVRSVFQHFADLEDLFVAVSDRQTNRVARLYTGTNYDGDLPSRIDVFVNYRSNLYETIAPIRRAAMLQEPFSRIVAERLELARNLHRFDVERAFGPELNVARAGGDNRLGDTIAAFCTFQVWDEMRRFSGYDVATATAEMRRVVCALLQPFA
ncbi:MAG TPA: TetR/AcrR family transcriptional regulator [Candidatus Limnocylindrales bacterium]|nr:TetR/AcrR family transcriptional regulator [Candidatus Limnocylindrales bacterium]